MSKFLFKSDDNSSKNWSNHSDNHESEKSCTKLNKDFYIKMKSIKEKEKRERTKIKEQK